MLPKSEIRREALNLPAQERIELVVELWDSLAPGEIPVPDWQRDLILDRLAALQDVLPDERSMPWEAVRKDVHGLSRRAPSPARCAAASSGGATRRGG